MPVAGKRLLRSVVNWRGLESGRSKELTKTFVSKTQRNYAPFRRESSISRVSPRFCSGAAESYARAVCGSSGIVIVAFAIALTFLHSTANILCPLHLRGRPGRPARLVL